MPDFLQHELKVAAAAAREAGALIRSRVGRRHDIREKSPHDLVTETDEVAQDLILGRLSESFPDDDILAEEGADLQAAGARPPARRWIVDPLDGTTNFTHGLAPYCVSIALQDEAGDLVLGVVYEIAMEELFTAVRGEGAFMNGVPVRVSATSRLADSLVTTGFPFREFWYVDEYIQVLRTFMLETRGVRRPGSAAADLAYVACGRFDAFFEAGLAPWDIAAGIVLVREAGGRIGGLAPGVDPLFSGQILATNRVLHASATQITRPLGEFFGSGEERL
jgi:myo-inositol-1(or 4)-monophosphatase